MVTSTSNNPILELIQGQIAEHVSSFDGTGQYTQGGTSTCGLAALNAVRIILGLEKSGVNTGVALLERIISKEVIDDIVAICARWASQLHLEVDDIAALPLFKNTLVLSSSDYSEAGSKNFTALLRRLEEISRNRASSAAVVITRPPEIFTVFHILTHTRRCPSIFAIFDSHPRPSKGAKGASFVLFSTLADTSDYITNLLRIDPSLLSGSLQWEAQLLGHYSGHIFLASNSYNANVDDVRFMYDANMEILELKSRLLDAEERSRVLGSENSALHDRIDQLEDISKHAHAVESSFWARETGDSRRPRSPIAGPSNYREASVTHDTPFLKNISNDSSPQAFSDVKKSIQKPRHGHDEARLDDRLCREPNEEQANWEAAWRAQEELDREHIELSSQMARLQDMAQVLFECPICFETHPEDFVARVDACSHQLCRRCMKEFLISKLEEHRYPIPCPICQTQKNVKDPGVITAGLVEQLGLTDAQHSVWTELELSQFSIVLQCPKCRCSSFVDINDHKDMKLLMCPLRGCNHVWCKECHRHVEPGTLHSCDGSLELDGLMKTRGWHYCPGCKTPTEKQSGCNHMTCPARGCNTHFCYRCGEGIVRSVRQEEIQPALTKHYRRCKLFEY